jgi:hypothetical protein
MDCMDEVDVEAHIWYYHDIRDRHITPEMNEYFSQFIAQNQKLF